MTDDAILLARRKGKPLVVPYRTCRRPEVWETDVWMPNGNIWRMIGASIAETLDEAHHRISKLEPTL